MRLPNFNIKNIFPLVVLLLAFAACNSDYTPKPRGYFRITVPENAYRTMDSIYPFTFSYPVYANISHDELAPQQKYWLNINYPQFKGIVHLSYKAINGNLNSYLEDTREMVFKHIPKASAINNRLIVNEEAKVYGLMYEISGIGAASPCQFYLTDSVNHFLRGALYFSVKPNNDSLAPVIDFVKQDIEAFITSFQWKDLD